MPRPFVAYAAPLPVLVVLLLLAGCRGDVDSTSDAPKAPPTSTSGVDSEVEPVAPERIQALLPAALTGSPRTDIGGSVRGALGVTTSVVQAHYGRGDSLITLTLTDVGGLGDPATLGYTWLGQEIDRTWDGGAERTLLIDGHPAYERSEERGPDAVHVFAGDRLVVELSSTGASLATLRRALDELPVERLAALAEQED